jgi:hypothetical protein
MRRWKWRLPYGLGNVIYNDCSLGISVIHWRQAVESFLSCSIPDFEFDRAIIDVAFLGQEGSYQKMDKNGA